jgi:hypothetical protein
LNLDWKSIRRVITSFRLFLPCFKRSAIRNIAKDVGFYCTWGDSSFYKIGYSNIVSFTFEVYGGVRISLWGLPKWRVNSGGVEKVNHFVYYACLTFSYFLFIMLFALFYIFFKVPDVISRFVFYLLWTEKIREECWYHLGQVMISFFRFLLLFLNF